MILPDYWPTYYSKSKGTHVWSLENYKYLDMMCYVGQNTLGYSNSLVDKKVISSIQRGNMTSLNSYNEIILSEKLMQLHPWADMAKFARSGGEANAMAIRIARAATQKDHVAFCGYHGWHDWYLSVNIKNKNNLNEHLLPGLDPHGVPKTKKYFSSVQIWRFEKLINISSKYDLAAIKMEVGRNSLPDEKFLNEVRDLADKKKLF